MATNKNTLKEWFKNLSKPTQEQFWAWLDAYWHKDEKIPQSNIEGFDELLNNLPDANALKNYLLKDGANIDESVRAALREKLGIGDIPSNVATIDKGNNEGSVYTKQQVDKKLEDLSEDTAFGNNF